MYLVGCGIPRGVADIKSYIKYISEVRVKGLRRTEFPENFTVVRKPLSKLPIKQWIDEAPANIDVFDNIFMKIRVHILKHC